jgi:UDP-N-acetylglucosamine transferase subunit ALG13
VIFATVGTHHQPFDRLVCAADRVALETEEPVVIQTGRSTVRPRHAQAFAYAPLAEIEAYMRAARVVVAHAGAGTVMTALRVARALVVVPRRRQYGEHVDDHQLELADAVAQRGLAVVVHDVASLARAIEQAPALSPGSVGGAPALIEALRQVLRELEAVRRSRP